MVTAQLTPAGVGIHNVLIATDFSQSSNAALDFGLQLTHDYHAKAYVAFVLPNDQFLLAGPEAYVAARDVACRDLEELKAELKRTRSYVEGEDYHLYLLEGQAAPAILEFARRQRADLIVVGTHGRTGLGKALLGSVAESVFRGSPVPVLTIGPCLRRAAPNNSPRNILVAADFTPASEQAVRYASALAREHGSQLTLLHVPNQKELDHAADRERTLQETKNRLAELLRREADGVPCKICVATGKVVPTILRTADAIEADLLVMGVRPPGAVLGRVMWPHAYEVVRESRCPVLTVRGAGREK
jgi:nucleotide-binding universal stress UspA family protein